MRDCEFVTFNEEPEGNKKKELVRILRDAGSLLVAFSGGVDSTFLLAVAHEILGDGVVAATAISQIYPAREKNIAKKFTHENGIEHVLFQTGLGHPDFVLNERDRCYHCKRHLFPKLTNLARDRNIKHVAHGANIDDLEDYRPGFRAAKEMGIVAPLVEAGLGKKDIRFLSKQMGLSTWDKPSMACLATRIPYGSEITVGKLKMIEEAEAFLVDNGIRQCRVRHHGPVARIEVEREGFKIVTGGDFKEAIVGKFRKIGFMHIAVDLEGFASGSMNRELGSEEVTKVGSD